MEGEIVINKSDSSEKREMAIAACLDQFVKKGLYETTSRDLSKALKLQAGGMYYYFSTKDEAVLVCAEEAAFLLEKYLINQAITQLHNPDAMLDELLDRAGKLSHMMKFLAQVCSVPKYKEGMKPALDRLNKRYKSYAEQVSKLLNCDTQELEPYFYVCVSAIANYMIFDELKNAVPQINLVKQAIKNFLINEEGKQ